MEISEVHQTYAGTKITIEGGRYIKGKYKTMVVTVTTCDCVSQNAEKVFYHYIQHIGYIKNTIDYGLTYTRGNGLSPYAYVDADYGGCRDTRRLTSSYVFMMAGGPVAWSSKRQATVALSTVEAEYVAMSRCAQQMVWMHSWLDEVEIEHQTPGVIKGDN